MTSPEDLVIQSSEVAIQWMEASKAKAQPPWGGFGGLLKVCDDPELQEHGTIRAAPTKSPSNNEPGPHAVASPPQPGNVQAMPQQAHPLQLQAQQQHMPQQLLQPVQHQQQLMQLYQQYQQHMTSLTGPSGPHPSHLLQTQRAPPVSAHAHAQHHAQHHAQQQPMGLHPLSHGGSSKSKVVGAVPAPGSNHGQGNTGSTAGNSSNVNSMQPENSGGSQPPGSMSEDLSHLYNSPSIAAARREAGLPAYVPPDDTSWIEALPKPPSGHRPKG